MTNSTKLNEFKNEYCHIKIENNILYAKYLCSILDKQALIKAYELRLEASKDKSFPVIIDCSLVKQFTKEARDFSGTSEAVDLISICAMVINSPLGEMLGNFYLKLKRPPVKTKMFNSLKDAEKWVLSNL